MNWIGDSVFLILKFGGNSSCQHGVMTRSYYELIWCLFPNILTKFSNIAFVQRGLKHFFFKVTRSENDGIISIFQISMNLLAAIYWSYCLNLVNIKLAERSLCFIEAIWSYNDLISASQIPHQFLQNQSELNWCLLPIQTWRT